jgi:hypothetical protein
MSHVARCVYTMESPLGRPGMTQADRPATRTDSDYFFPGAGHVLDETPDFILIHRKFCLHTVVHS